MTTHPSTLTRFRRDAQRLAKRITRTLTQKAEFLSPSPSACRPSSKLSSPTNALPMTTDPPIAAQLDPLARPLHGRASLLRSLPCQTISMLKCASSQTSKRSSPPIC